jgi:DNA-binding MarR family transcriptional regulator
MQSADLPIVLDQFLPYRLAVLASTVSHAMAKVYSKRFNVSIAEWRILANLGHFGPLFAGELAERSSMDKPKVTRALKRLATADLVSRETDPDDRRQTRVSLTAKGHTTFYDIAKLASTWERDLLDPLTDNERATFEICIQKLQTRANQMRVVPKPLTKKPTGKL